MQFINLCLAAIVGLAMAAPNAEPVGLQQEDKRACLSLYNSCDLPNVNEDCCAGLYCAGGTCLQS